MAMKLGTVDGYMASPQGLEEQKFKEVLGYYLDWPNPGIALSANLINQKSFDALPEDLQQRIMIDGPGMAQYYAREYEMVQYYVLRSVAKETGLKVIKWSAEDAAKIRKASIETLWEQEAAKSPRCAKLVEMVRAQAKDLGKID